MSGPLDQRQVALDRCLQCGKSRNQVRDYFDSPCATASGYETVEGLDDWPRHHWRDWSAAMLTRMGIPAEWFPFVRRTDFYDLEFVSRAALCFHRGQHDPYEDAPELCRCCYAPTTDTTSPNIDPRTEAK